MTSVLLVGCLAIVVVTGVLLSFFSSPTDVPIYDGPYEPLRGVEMSTAYASELELTFETPGSLLLRASHHWAGLVFLVVAVFRLVLIRRFLQVLPVLALLGLAALNVVVGKNSEQVPTSWWYTVHLLLTVMTAAALMIVWRRSSRPG